MKVRSRVSVFPDAAKYYELRSDLSEMRIIFNRDYSVAVEKRKLKVEGRRIVYNETPMSSKEQELLCYRAMKAFKTLGKPMSWTNFYWAIASCHISKLK